MQLQQFPRHYISSPIMPSWGPTGVESFGVALSSDERERITDHFNGNVEKTFKPKKLSKKEEKRLEMDRIAKRQQELDPLKLHAKSQARMKEKAKMRLAVNRWE